MPNYPNLANLSSNPSVGDFMSLPNSTYPYFWAWILTSIWLIIVTTSYFAEKSRNGKGNILSSMAVSCFVIIVLSAIGTAFGVVSLEIMIYIIAISVVIWGIWFFTNK